MNRRLLRNAQYNLDRRPMPILIFAILLGAALIAFAMVSRC